MNKRAQENVVAIAFFLVFLFFFVVSMSYSAKARLVPVPLAAISAGLILLQLYLQNFRMDIRLNVDAMDLFAKRCEKLLAREKGEEEAGQAEKRLDGGKERAAFGLVVLYLGLILLFGIMQATFLYVLAYFLFVGREKWYKSLAWSVISTAVLYLLFVEILQVWMYEGWLATAYFQR